MEEETLSGQNTEKLPPNRTQCPRPQITTTNKKKNKRKRSDVDIHNSAYFKIRALVLQVRPYFVEALQTPDFCNCKAAYEIRKRALSKPKNLQVTKDEAYDGFLQTDAN
ncbi:uncharacterized protein LOC130758570 isoform X2 [Actinidia eriantha]|uniref:uncharacterized protein LOC130758570 isoform X2 n=1 Tax=Actinidia eriantha TaxID=165200 RepID=UPI00258FBEC7|nr:uncharacterized protein LOC130758570 isoform X2 [Actinidia eriantha]